MEIMDTLPETTLREVVQHKTFAGDKAHFSTENWKDIQFELNHLELHSMDDYLFTMHSRGIQSDSNEGNSYIAYLLGITTKKPDGPLVTVGGSFPDIDLDFEKERREEVRQHLVERYGKDKVAAIGTFQFPKPKGLFKDTARMHDLDFKLSNQISKMIPDRPDLDNFQDALAESAELKALYDSDPKIKQIIDYAEKLEGTIRTIGVHACGMCISIDPIAETVPLFDSKGTSVTQFDGPTLEKIGLIKYDILGLKNLSTMSKTMGLIKKTRDIDIDVEELDLDDHDLFESAFKLIATGNSLGIFQIEGSQGLRDFAAASKPDSIHDLAAVISLYRPGPMGMGALDKYLARKNGRESAVFDVPKYHYIFKDTYGLLVYQEQLMILAADMCGFDDIETDVLRKAVGKKDRDLLLAQKAKFVSGAVANGEDEYQISVLFDEMEEFARYCFNKSHAICYAKIGCQTAWLKANYLSEYMAALISTEEDPDQQALYIEDARRNGVNVQPPDLNNSSKDFTVGSKGEILFGFNCIKGVGGAAVTKILDLQPFDSFGDFIIKGHHAKGINKKIIEALINCGACDVFGWKRSCMISRFENFLSEYKKSSTNYAKKNNSPLKENPDGFKEVISFYLDNEDGYFDSTEIPEYPILKVLDYEKELLGINVSGNPFTEVGKLVKENFKSINDLTLKDQSSYILGQINKVKKIVTKKGDPMAFFDMTDGNGDSRSFTLFPQTYEKCAAVLVEGTFVLAMTTSSTSDRGKDFIVNAVRDLTLCIDTAEDKAEAKRSMKSIDVHMVGTLGTVRFRSLIKKIEEYIEEKDTGYSITLKCDVGNTVLSLKTWSVARIDIPMLREFGKLTDVYVTRGS
jgi:DNA polymerase-3 subunit alpha